jgi:hypothetical protein
MCSRVFLSAFVIVVTLALAGRFLRAQESEELPEVYPGQLVAWDPADSASQKKTNYYEFRIEGVTQWRKVGLAETWPVPTVIAGTYRIEVRACQTLKDKPPNCSSGTPLRVRILAPDSLPTPPRPPANFLPVCRTP